MTYLNAEPLPKSDPIVSSGQVGKGGLILRPYGIYGYVRENGLGRYEIPPADAT